MRKGFELSPAVPVWRIFRFVCSSQAVVWRCYNIRTIALVLVLLNMGPRTENYHVILSLCPPRQGEWLYGHLAPGSEASDPICEDCFEICSKKHLHCLLCPPKSGSFLRWGCSHQWLDNFATAFCTHHSNKYSLFAYGPKLGTLTCIRVCILSHGHQSEPLTWSVGRKKVLLRKMCAPAQHNHPQTMYTLLLKPAGWWKFTLLRSWPLVASSMCSRRGP